MEPSFPPRNPPPPLPAVAHHTGELGRYAARLLKHGFIAVWITRKSGPIPSPKVTDGFAGDEKHMDVLQVADGLGEVVRDTLSLDEVDVSFSNGERVLRRYMEFGDDRLYFAGIEIPGDHRKSTPRNIRRLLKNITRDQVRSRPADV